RGGRLAAGPAGSAPLSCPGRRRSSGCPPAPDSPDGPPGFGLADRRRGHAARPGRPAWTADDQATGAPSEEVDRRPDLLRRVPGQFVTLRLVDDELCV